MKDKVKCKFKIYQLDTKHLGEKIPRGATVVEYILYEDVQKACGVILLELLLDLYKEIKNDKRRRNEKV